MDSPKLHGWRSYEPSIREQQEVLERVSQAYLHIAPVNGDGSVVVLENALERTPGIHKPQRMETTGTTIWAMGARFRPRPGEEANVRILFPYAVKTPTSSKLERDVAVYLRGQAVEQDVELVLRNLEARFLHSDKGRLLEQEALPDRA